VLALQRPAEFLDDINGPTDSQQKDLVGSVCRFVGSVIRLAKTEGYTNVDQGLQNTRWSASGMLFETL